MLRVILVIVTVGMLASACSASATRTPTRSPSPAPSPASTFPLEDQEQRSDALNTFAAEHGWAAGCLWPAGTTSTNAETLRRLEVPNRPGLTYRKRQARSGAVMVIVYRDTTGAVDTGFNEVLGPGFLCYRPVGTVLAPNRA
ncbi:MAG: hypothetical protein ABI782_06715 [Anaerolineaceae bacterium]